MVWADGNEKGLMRRLLYCNENPMCESDDV